ncbi:MAG: hypothetical protein PHO26_09840 [Dehalococcoidia bacterium]|nr:hypothetical protein [Dehalococcoidia bacterium]MDD5494790.1 hypothetical protein [Dehalococcoidia bacterium]
MIMSNNGSDIAFEDIFSFLKENGFTGTKLRLLFFWCRHPQAKFDLDCIARFMDTTHHHLNEMLRDLIEKGMIKEQYCSSGMAHYSINPEHAVSDYISELAKLDWGVLRSIQGELEKEAIPA